MRRLGVRGCGRVRGRAAGGALMFGPCLLGVGQREWGGVGGEFPLGRGR